MPFGPKEEMIASSQHRRVVSDHRRHPGSATGFTLIELLVVISIVAILIAILLPALGNARDATRSVSCLSNQRQLGVMFNTYANDFEGIIPPTTHRPFDPAAAGEGFNGYRYWLQQLAEYGGASQEDPDQLKLYCPTFPEEFIVGFRGTYAMNQLMSSHSTGSYQNKFTRPAYNYTGTVSTPSRYFDMFQVPTPSKMYLVSDTFHNGTSTIYYMPIIVGDVPLTLRHSERVNVLMFDSSAATRETLVDPVSRYGPPSGTPLLPWIAGTQFSSSHPEID